MFKTALKSLLSRKLRLLLSGLAVVLGVMAVSAALVLNSTLTESFNTLFQTANKNVDVQITAESEINSQSGNNPPVPRSVINELKNVAGVKDIAGDITVDGARVIGSNGKVIPTTGPPRLGGNWTEDTGGFVQLREGHGPRQDNEVAINASLAKAGDFKLGDNIEIITLQPKKTFRVSGIFGYSGGRDSNGGETLVTFTEPVAQELLLGEKNVYSAINLKAEDGVSQQELANRVKDVVAGQYKVRTGEQVAKDQAGQINDFIGIFSNFLLGFAAVALFVGIFLILNTFSIIVAQRTKELALFRAMGASRRQIINIVLVEAVVIGIIASTLGFAAGIGIAALLKKFLESQNGAPLPGEGLIIPAAAIIASYVVGILVTVLAALLPATRASRIPPIAAMREAADTQRPLTKITIGGAVLLALGITGVALALTGTAGDYLWPALLLGVLFVFIGIAMLTPIIAQPVVSAVGRLFSWSLPGKLGRRNSARNPRRTAITAAALMIGLALVTGVSVIAASLSASMSQVLKSDMKAQLLIGSDTFNSGTPATFSPSLVNDIKEIPGVDTVADFYGDFVKADGNDLYALGADGDALTKAFEVETKAGELRSLRSGEILLGENYAKDKNLTVGDKIEITTFREGASEFSVVGIYKPTQIISGPIMSIEDATKRFQYNKPIQAFVVLNEGANSEVIQNKIDGLLKDYPEITVRDQTEFLNQLTSQVNQLVTMLYVLLGLALIIAILGIVNTLVLSILERTRELGLLRAVGLGRGQVMQMVTVESIVISVFGALLGLVVGCGLGTAVVKALQNEGFEVLSFPWTRMAVFLLIAVVVGLIAAIAPAIRAARVNVLKAISYE